MILCMMIKTILRFAFGVWNLGFGVGGLGFRASGLGVRGSGFGFRVSGLGLVVWRQSAGPCARGQGLGCILDLSYTSWVTKLSVPINIIIIIWIMGCVGLGFGSRISRTPQ
jgi:hypothetical protein